MTIDDCSSLMHFIALLKQVPLVTLRQRTQEQKLSTWHGFSRQSFRNAIRAQNSKLVDDYNLFKVGPHLHGTPLHGFASDPETDQASCVHGDITQAYGQPLAQNLSNGCSTTRGALSTAAAVLSLLHPCNGLDAKHPCPMHRLISLHQEAGAAEAWHVIFCHAS